MKESPVAKRSSGAAASVPAGVLALWILLGVACGPDDPEPAEGPPFSRLDSAGVQISINRGGGADEPLGWTVEAEADLVLGSGDAPSDYFDRIQGIRGTRDGGVLVVDGGSRELRFYDAEGRVVKRTGGPGEGPGEFLDPVLVPVVGTDSLLVFDTDLPRAHVLSPEGELGRLIHHTDGRRPYGGRAPVGAAGFGHMLFDASGTAGGPETPSPDQGMVQLRQRFMWYDTAVGGLLTVDSVLVDGYYYDRPMVWHVPFTPRSSAATTAAGTFIARGRPAEIMEYDVEGSLRRVFRIEGFSRPVTQEMIDVFIDLDRSRRPDRYGSLPRSAWYGVHEDIGIPDTLPAFQALRLDELGWLWAEIYEFDPSEPSEWVVFDPEGRAHGTVRTPPGLEIHWIGGDAVLGVWRDELEVEYVHRHRLTRDAGPGDAG